LQFLVADEGGGVDADLGFRTHERARVQPPERKRIRHRPVAHRPFLAGVGAAGRDRCSQLRFWLEYLIEAGFALVVEGADDQKATDVAELAHPNRRRFLVTAAGACE
jgi:hypothetical protein